MKFSLDIMFCNIGVPFQGHATSHEITIRYKVLNTLQFRKDIF